MTNVATLQTAADLSASITAQGISSLVPAGAILAFGGATAPTGWLLCNGAAISRVTYADLFAAISTAHGYGDNVAVTGTFNLPDYRGRFIRGRDGAVTRDPDRAGRTAANTGGSTGDNVGSVQGDAMQRMTGNIQANEQINTNYTINFGASGVFSRLTTGSYTNCPNNGTILSGTGGALNYDTSLQARTSTETRSLNAYVNYIIKI